MSNETKVRDDEGRLKPIFAEDTMRWICEFYPDVPRLINRACTQVLTYAYQNRRAIIIDDRMVQIVPEDEAA